MKGRWSTELMVNVMFPLDNLKLETPLLLTSTCEPGSFNTGDSGLKLWYFTHYCFLGAWWTWRKYLIRLVLVSCKITASVKTPAVSSVTGVGWLVKRRPHQSLACFRQMTITTSLLSILSEHTCESDCKLALGLGHPTRPSHAVVFNSSPSMSSLHSA